MPEGDNASRKPMKIRKYPNRRYYDTSRSRHVTLDEIYALIRDGNEIEVTDSKSGDDITAKVLAQIIIELDPPKLTVFPVPLLHRLLRSNERMMGDFVEKYFNQPLAAFLDQQRNMEQYFRQAMGLRSGVPTVADWAKMMLTPLNAGMWGGEQGANGANSAAAEPANGSTDDLRRVINELREEIAELKSRDRGKRRTRNKN